MHANGRNRRYLTTCALFTLVCIAGVPLKSGAQTILVDTEADYSLTAEGANGLSYGYYDSYLTTGSFTTAGMYTASGYFWDGPDGAHTPQFTATQQHEAVNSSGVVINSAVRRYTFGSPGTNDYTGEVTVDYSIWKTPFGAIGNGADAFITFDGVQQYEVRVPNVGTQSSPYVTGQLTLSAAPGDTLDFGTTDFTRNGISDEVGFTAIVYEGSPAATPEPSRPEYLLTAFSGAALLLGVRRRRAQHLSLG